MIDSRKHNTLNTFTELELEFRITEGTSIGKRARILLDLESYGPNVRLLMLTQIV